MDRPKELLRQPQCVPVQLDRLVPSAPRRRSDDPRMLVHVTPAPAGTEAVGGGGGAFEGARTTGVRAWDGRSRVGRAFAYVRQAFACATGVRAYVLLGALSDLAQLREAHAHVQALRPERVRKDEHVLLDHARRLLVKAQHAVHPRQQMVRLGTANAKGADERDGPKESMVRAGAHCGRTGRSKGRGRARDGRIHLHTARTWLMNSGTISFSLRTRSACTARVKNADRKRKSRMSVHAHFFHSKGLARRRSTSTSFKMPKV